MEKEVRLGGHGRIELRLSPSKKAVQVVVDGEIYYTSKSYVEKLLRGEAKAVKLRKLRK